MVWWKLAAWCCSRNLRIAYSYSGKRLLSTQFGICFDIDGVLVRGLVPIPEAIEAFGLLCHPSTNQLKVPSLFVTNGFSLNAKKAKWLSEFLKVQVSEDQLVQAHSPLSILNSLKDKHCLFIGQGPVVDIARQDLGLKNVCSIEDVCKAYPLLDVVDHEKCRTVSQQPIKDFGSLPKVEAIVICGEPKHWETPLQLLIDLLLTAGTPSLNSVRSHHQTLPLIVCNPDLQYMARSHLPRFGNGAFLACLETLFKKITGNDLQYSTIIGKPSEITYRYAEHCLSTEARRLSSQANSLKTFYMIGDNAEADILGANLYKRYIAGELVPASRTIPKEVMLLPQTITSVVSILVQTGVSSHKLSMTDTTEKQRRAITRCQSHRDFVVSDASLFQPDVSVGTVLDAVQYILSRENQANVLC